MTDPRTTKRRSAERTDLWLCLLIGILLAGFGSAAAFDRDGYDAPPWLGPFLLWAAGSFTVVGVIGLGISMGLSASRPSVDRREPPSL